MKFSIELPPKDPLWRLKIYSSIIEKLGFSAIWTSEHYYNRSSAVSCVAIGQVTSRIQICVGILNPYMVHPALIAQIAATLSEMYPGRISIGVGAGDKLTLENLGIQQREPLKKVEETVNILKKLLSGKRLNEYIRLDFRSWGKIPIYIAAQGQNMLKLAARIADGVLINFTGLENTQKAVATVRDCLNASNKAADQFSTEVTVMVSVSEDRSKAIKTIMPYTAILALGIGESHLEQFGLDSRRIEKLKYFTKTGNWQEVQNIVPEDLVNALSISGTPIEVYSRLMELLRMPIDGVVFGGPLGPNPRKALAHLWDIVSRHMS